MKKVLPLVLLFACVYSSHAQKVDLDRYWFTTSNRSLPSKPLPDGSRTYRVEVTNSSIVSSIYTNEAIKNTLTIDGYKYTDPYAHLTITVFFSDVRFERSGITERKEDVKDKDGKVTGQKSYFSAWSNYRFGADIYVKDSNMQVLDHYEPYSTNNVLTYNSPEFGSSVEASNYFNNNIGDIKRTLVKNLTDNALANTRNMLRTQYGYPVNQVRDYLWVLDSKKHDEYKHQQEIWDQFKAIASRLNGAESISEDIKNQLKPVMSYFDSLRVRFTTEEKADKKFRHCSYYTMAKIYLLLDNPEAALKEADLLVTNGFDAKDAEPLKRDANTMIDRFKKNAVSSTHFALDVSVNKAPTR